MMMIMYEDDGDAGLCRSEGEWLEPLGVLSGGRYFASDWTRHPADWLPGSTSVGGD